MLSQIVADQRHEGLSEKSWLGMANRLHCTAGLDFQDRVPILSMLGTTSRHGPSTGESLVQHRWGKVVYTTKSVCAEPIFLVRIPFPSEPCPNFSAV